MNFEFKSKKLEQLYTEEKNAHKYPGEVIDNFFEVMLILESVPDEQTLLNKKIGGRKPEKLKGKRGVKGQYSIRLNQQFRLIFTIETDPNDKYLLIIEIVDYH
ncbi:MAG: hypothetical protein RLZZ490_1120 [Cyanobacteriota bacterium]|jgi:proteic killer suppression protein